MRSLEESDSQRQKVNGGVQGLGEGKEEAVLEGLQFGKMKGSGDDGWSWLYNNVSVLNATDLYT